MPNGVITSNHLDRWVARDKDIKHYFHFDRKISKTKLEKIANDPDIVARNAFYPLLRFTEEWLKFRKPGEKYRRKSRPLRYASRRDAAIYARYRVCLSEMYEHELIKRGIQAVPIAYRRIANNLGHGNKSNIEFARDVFTHIKDIENCYVTVLDIKSFFENLDHDIILNQWEKLIGGNLPPDHMAVYKSLTQYAYVDVDPLFDRLGMHQKDMSGSKSERRSRKIDGMRKRGEKQVCTPREFRELVCGGDKDFPSLIQKNREIFGIPQGAPISDLVANFYLIDFDEEVYHFCKKIGGYYFRYSDDIVCIVPSNASSEFEIKDYIQAKISKFGSKLQIQDKKVSICEFSGEKGGLVFRNIFSASGRNGLEYLGFEFDGKVVKIKNSTLSNAWRKLSRFSYGYAKRYVKQYRGKGDAWIVKNYPRDWVQKNRLKDVTYNQDNGFEDWTFVKYTRRASKAFFDFPRIFSSQTKKYRYLTSLTIERNLLRAIGRYGHAAMRAQGRVP